VLIVHESIRIQMGILLAATIVLGKKLLRSLWVLLIYKVKSS